MPLRREPRRKKYSHVAHITPSRHSLGAERQRRRRQQRSSNNAKKRRGAAKRRRAQEEFHHRTKNRIAQRYLFQRAVVAAPS